MVIDEGTTRSVEETGTRIEVRPLLPSVADDFSSTGVLATLGTDLRLRHLQALERGLRIELNGQLLAPRPPRLLASAAIVPLYRDLEIPAGDQAVRLAIYAGILGLGQDQRDDGDAEDFRLPSEAGWYLFCNDRLILVADRTRLTGWGAGAAYYHPQYRQFRGYAYLSASDLSLPWNTTKTGVDRDSDVFRATQTEMQVALQSVQGALNRLKKERQQNDPDARPISAAIAAATEVGLDEIGPSDSMEIPAPDLRVAADTRRISYGVPKERV